MHSPNYDFYYGYLRFDLVELPDKLDLNYQPSFYGLIKNENIDVFKRLEANGV